METETHVEVSTMSSSSSSIQNLILAILPLVPSIYIFCLLNDDTKDDEDKGEERTTLQLTLLKSVLISVVGFFFTIQLIPVVGEYTKKCGMSGKDLGKKGTPDENKDIPEALGLCSGTIFLMCTICSQLLFASSCEQLTIFNSALFSICFMIFLGFTDDTLELKWRYKLILPTLASLPLLVSYSGSTAVYIPPPLQPLLMLGSDLTLLGKILDSLPWVVVDTNAQGAILELNSIFLLYMGLLAVFCTNAINIYAGINGLEAGQSYVIGCSILFFKLYDLYLFGYGESQIFSLILIIPFLAVTLGLLRFNWYPASVFVGDTFCYFAGMTFAVVGIHGHFSKTLLLLFIPQILNFLYSIPQLFKIIPCPRHRLPRVDVKSHTLYFSAFPCREDEYKLFKVKSSDLECPNCTLICAVLRVTGPLKERTLCLVLLGLQILSSCLAFYVRYHLLGEEK